MVALLRGVLSGSWSRSPWSPWSCCSADPAAWCRQGCPQEPPSDLTGSQSYNESISSREQHFLRWRVAVNHTPTSTGSGYKAVTSTSLWAFLSQLIKGSNPQKTHRNSQSCQRNTFILTLDTADWNTRFWLVQTTSSWDFTQTAKATPAMTWSHFIKTNLQKMTQQQRLMQVCNIPSCNPGTNSETPELLFLTLLPLSYLFFTFLVLFCSISLLWGYWCYFLSDSSSVVKCPALCL